jgi:2-methylcitrate dehydratase PrpD
VDGEIRRAIEVSGQNDTHITRSVVKFVGNLRTESLSVEVLHECDRAFTNAVGCVVGGARHQLVDVASNALVEFGGSPAASALGRGVRTDVLTAALLNGLAGAAYSFDDTYSDALLHPSVPLVAALLPLAERTPINGKEFRAAFAAGMEVACRLTKAVATSPAEPEMAWSQTGIVCGIAVALASGKLMGLSEDALGWAAGIAASEAAGTRATHGSMAASLIFGRASQTGLRAAFLAAQGFTGPSQPLEHRFGFARVFAKSANLPALVDGLGERFELMSNTYKPYPCGLVIHPAIDGVLQLKAARPVAARDVVRIKLVVSPAAVKFGFRPDPIDDLEAKVSLHHWIAVALSRGKAGLAEGTKQVVDEPEVRALRAIIDVVEDPAVSNDAAGVELVLRSGDRLATTVSHCIGSIQRPMTDAELNAKCIDQATLVIGSERAHHLSHACWKLGSLEDVGLIARLAF